MPKTGPDGVYDRTALYVKDEGRRVHRDYAAHYFRWGWAVRNRDIGVGERSTLDIGCGIDVSLLNVGLYAKQVPSFYVGVDLNNLREMNVKKAKLYGKTNFADPATWQMLLENHGQFERIVCFECIEHMPIDEGWKLLWGVRQLLAPGGIFLLSTPVFNGKMAPNHVHEYTIDELQKYVEAVGFRVIKRYGTYANVRDSLTAIDAWAVDHGYTDAKMFRELWNELSDYYTTDVLATFVAPAIPNAARNNVWRLELKHDQDTGQ